MLCTTEKSDKIKNYGCQNIEGRTLNKFIALFSVSHTTFLVPEGYVGGCRCINSFRIYLMLKCVGHLHPYDRWGIILHFSWKTLSEEIA